MMGTEQMDSDQHGIPQTESDFESGLNDDDRLDLRIWLRLLTCANMIERRVRQNLRTNFDTTLPRFDVLAQIDRAPDNLAVALKKASIFSIRQIKDDIKIIAVEQFAYLIIGIENTALARINIGQIAAKRRNHFGIGQIALGFFHLHIYAVDNRLLLLGACRLYCHISGFVIQCLFRDRTFFK